MKGFDSKWKDFPDYILGITAEIWEERNIAALEHYYAADIMVRAPASLTVGNKNVIAATMATLAEFPDRRLLGEEVIWCGTPEDGLLSSHRILSTATHTGDGVYGRATGTKLAYRIIADCHAINNQINDEWIIRDQGAIVRQLGWTPESYTRDLILREGGIDHCTRPFTPDIDKVGAYTGKGNDNEWGQCYADMLGRIMAADMATIETSYDEACQLELPGGETVHGRAAADNFWMGLRSSFPHAKFTIDHQIGREDKTEAPRAAIRWSLQGKHEGWGRFGEPSGADVYIMAISHAEYGPRGLRREYITFDETAIWKQIIMQAG